MKILKGLIGISKSDWDITGDGGIAIVEDGGSKRCRLSGSKLLLWNGNSECVDYEVVADLSIMNTTNYRGGLVLRSNDTGTTMYRLRVYGSNTTARIYYIDQLINNVNTVLGVVVSNHPFNVFVKTRFRVDGFQLSVEEWIDGAWELITAIEDTTKAITSGYCGLIGMSYTSSYYITFDNIEINKKE